MSAANKRAGAKYETDLLKALRAHGLDVERLPKAGRSDEGDLLWRNGGIPVVIEAKNVKTVNMTEFVRQASVEAMNYQAARDMVDAPWFATAIKKRRAPIMDSFILVPLWHWIEQTAAPF